MIDPTNTTSKSRRRFLRGALSLGMAVAAQPSKAAALRAAPEAKRRMIDWRPEDVAKLPGGYQVAVADVNGDGRLDILGLSGDNSIVEWYENPTWKARPVTTATHKNISLAPLFRPGYAPRGMALASEFALNDSTYGGNLWWAEPAANWDAEWRLHPIGKIPSSHRLRWANLDRSGRLALVDLPLLGPGAVEPDYRVPAPLTWLEMPETVFQGQALAQGSEPAEWPAHLIDQSLSVAHGICIRDWDGDGRDEILTASFEGVHLFHSGGRGADMTWVRTQLAAGDQQSTPKRGSS
jgi:hypothetical protein